MSRRILISGGLVAFAVIIIVVVLIVKNLRIADEIHPIYIVHNADWTPVEQVFHGVELMQVPTGCFDMGSDPQAYSVGNRGTPVGGHICFNNAFWIDKTEVTNYQFVQFQGIAAQLSYWVNDNLPREMITWFEARDFCVRRGGRLPTEAEWEYATRGPDNLIFPWGNDFFVDKIVAITQSNFHVVSVGRKPGGASWVGALDLTGNVEEWVSTLYRSYPYPIPDSGAELRDWINTADTINVRVARGGAFLYGITYFHAASRFAYQPNRSDNLVGFRCVVSSLAS